MSCFLGTYLYIWYASTRGCRCAAPCLIALARSCPRARYRTCDNIPSMCAHFRGGVNRACLAWVQKTQADLPICGQPRAPPPKVIFARSDKHARECSSRYRAPNIHDAIFTAIIYLATVRLLRSTLAFCHLAVLFAVGRARILRGCPASKSAGLSLGGKALRKAGLSMSTCHRTAM
ncbi:hypothetical protein BC629DRAFT_323527 [Irpex lacteus]|nr:hypothetical protein BC629DRAFT_323527 [Irpex lacteus]